MSKLGSQNSGVLGEGPQKSEQPKGRCETEAKLVYGVEATEG
jgi:hypothetical protein